MSSVKQKIYANRTIDNETVCSHLEKFYLADTALRCSVLGYAQTSIAAMLENVVYLELLRRGYSVNIGKTPDGEIDFIATKQAEKL